MEGVEKLQQIGYLKVDELRINDQGLKRIAMLPRVYMLDVQYEYFTDAGLLYLAKMPNLRRLNISHSSLCTESGVARLKRMKPNLGIIKVQM